MRILYFKMILVSLIFLLANTVRAEKIPEDAKIMDQCSPKKNLRMVFNVGYLFFESKIPSVRNKAISCIEAAAEGGYFKARLFFGNMYLHGDGVPKDNSRAVMWITLAALEVEEDATSFLREFNEITPSQLEEGKQLVLEWLRQHPKIDAGK